MSYKFVAAWLLTCSAMFCTAGAGVISPPPAASTSEPASGIWYRHEFSFTFLGFTSTYSCDGLADKLRDLLIAAGARPDAKAYPNACAAGFGRPDKLASARLVFYTLSPPGARPAGDAAPDGQARPASWHPVVFTTRSPRNLERGDCELVEQFVTGVLPMFTTRNVENRTTCVPHQESGSVINLSFETLTAVQVNSHHLRPSNTVP